MTEPVTLGQLMGEKPGHTWFMVILSQRRHQLQQTAHRIGQRKGNPFADRGDAHLRKKSIDPVPQDNRLPLTDKKGKPGGCGCPLQILGSQQMGMHHVINIGNIHAVGAITKASGSSAQPLNSHYTKQLGTGAAWSTPDDNVDMRFIAYGTYTTLQEGN